MPDPIANSPISGDLGQIALPVQNIQNSIAFYRDKLGLPLLFEVPPNLAFFRCGTVRLMLSENKSAKPVPSACSVFYFRVRQIQDVHAELLRRGIVFEEPPHLVAKMPDHELWMAFLRDPDGQPLGLMEEIKT